MIWSYPNRYDCRIGRLKMDMMSWGKEVAWIIVLYIAECSLQAGKNWRISCVIHALVIWSLVKQSKRIDCR